MASGITATAVITAAVIAAGVHTRAVGVGRAVADDHGDDDDDSAENDVSGSRHGLILILVFFAHSPH